MTYVDQKKDYINSLTGEYATAYEQLLEAVNALPRPGSAAIRYGHIETYEEATRQFQKIAKEWHLAVD